VERAIWRTRSAKERLVAVEETLGKYLQKDVAMSPAELAALRRPSWDRAVRYGDGDGDITIHQVIQRRGATGSVIAQHLADG
jgi:hypothetical protein